MNDSNEMEESPESEQKELKLIDIIKSSKQNYDKNNYSMISHSVVFDENIMKEIDEMRKAIQ